MSKNKKLPEKIRLAKKTKQNSSLLIFKRKLRAKTIKNTTK